ncbi:MAG: Hsp70 family protein [Chloroflexi bacterium HGW-Chloroflexi-10]|nr:MAG: Hsp70 family protein [Chloroflexi bacterium HGW-Chloroflexi-10]
MAGKIAVDFGTSNTLVTKWDENNSHGNSIFIPEFSRYLPQYQDSIATIPSLIHYTSDHKIWIGNQVHQHDLYGSRHTFRWMKRYIATRNPVRINVHGTEITPLQAGKDFLTSVLTFALTEAEINSSDEIAFSVPVESFEHYENWISSVAQEAGIMRYRLIDEPSAAALGYGASIQANSVYLILDIGGGTMHSSVVLMTEEAQLAGGRRCRVLGKAGKDIGGTTIDQWLFTDFLKKNKRKDFDADIRPISNQILAACEHAKEILSTQDEAAVSIRMDSGVELSHIYHRDEFEEILDSYEFFAEINQTIQASINAARERGYDENKISAILMVGGSSQIPAVQKALRYRFGKDRVFTHRPIDAVAAGAAAFISGVDFFDYIQHEYAIRYVNPQSGEYAYKTLVERGTSYPSLEPVAKLTIKASYDGQEKLGIAIFEIGQTANQKPNGMELIFDQSGSARVIPISAQEQENRRLFWMNENNQTFLCAEPPAHKSEARFSIELHIDENKRLTITARDLKSNQLLYSNFPVVKLV